MSTTEPTPAGRAKQIRDRLNEIAPYPDTDEATTAASLGRWLAMRSQVISQQQLGITAPWSRDQIDLLTILFAAAMGMLWLGVIPLVSGYVADLFGTRNMATLLGVSFVVHQMGSVVGAWGGGMIFDTFGNYDLAWRFGVSMGIAAGLVQILFGGPSGTWSRLRTMRAAH